MARAVLSRASKGKRSVTNPGITKDSCNAQNAAFIARRIARRIVDAGPPEPIIIDEMSSSPTRLPLAELAFTPRIGRFLAGIVRGLSQILQSRCSLLIITAIAVLVSILARFPPYELLPELHRDIKNQALAWQIQHLLTAIPAYMKDLSLYDGSASH